MRARIVLGTLLLLTIVLVVGVPWLVRWQTIDMLEETLQQQVEIRDLSINPFRGSAHVGGIAVGDDTSVESVEVEIEILPLINGELRVEALRVEGVQVPIEFGEDGLSVAHYRLPDEPADESSSPAWRVALSNGAVADIVIRLVVNGLPIDFTLHEASVTRLVPGEQTSYQFDATIDGARASGRGSLVIVDGGVVIDGTLSVTALSVARYRSITGVDVGATIDIEGGHHVEVDRDTVMSFDGSVEVVNLDLSTLFATTVTRLAWVGTSKVQLGENGSPRFEVNGDVEARAISIDPFGAVRHVVVSGLNAGENRFAAQSLAVDGIDALLHRDESGHLASLPVLQEEDGEGESASDQAPAAFDVSIAEIVVDDGAFRFVDESVDPGVELAFANMHARATNLSREQRMRYELSADRADASSEDAHALVSEGEIGLFESPISGDLTLSLTQFELHEVGSYIGGGIRSGRLRLESTVEIAEGVVNANNDIRIEGIKVDEATADESQEMPLSLALSLLKDGDGNVELNVPITASVDRFTVNTDDIVQTAIKNAAKTAALTYAKFALQPFGTLLLLKGVADKVARPQFEPMYFDAREVELDDEASAYAGKLAQLLENRPGLSLTVCGYATRRDKMPEGGSETDVPVERGATAEQVVDEDDLRALAEARGRAVRDAIRAAGVESERLFSCAPLVLDNDDRPRVELKL